MKKNTDFYHQFEKMFPTIPKNDLKAFLSICTYKKCKNKEKIIEKESTIRNFAFIISGVVRGYVLDKNGVEKNLYLRKEGWFLGTHDHLFKAQPTKYTYESISKAEILLFNLDELQAICKTNPSLNELYTWGLRDTIYTISNRIESLICLSPEERYEELILNNPIFFNKAFNKHIANYLGITAPAFSRLIKRNKKKNPQTITLS